MTRSRSVTMALAITVGLAMVACTGSDVEDAGGTTGTTVLTSPDGDLEIRVWLDHNRSLRYRIDRGGGGDAGAVVSASRLQVSFAEAEFVDGLSIVSVDETRLRTFALDLPRGKVGPVTAAGTERSIVVENSGGDRLAVDLVAFDDGVGHRFRTLTAGPWTLVADRSSFAFGADGDAEMFVQPYDRTGTYTPASEALYSGGRSATEIYPAFNGWSFPALFHRGDHWILVTETAVGSHDVGSRLVNERGSAEHVLTPPPADQPEGPSAFGSVEGPDALPWKVIITSTDLADIVASTIADLLAEPSEIDDPSWVVPGRVSWSWWSDSSSPTRPDVLRRFIDFSATMGWEYSLIDANWDAMDPPVVAELVANARDLGVGIFLWYNSGGPHNTVAERPRDRMTDPVARRAEMAWLRELGVAGIKVDFFHSDKASMNLLALDILADAAEFELLVNFHGITSPKGWHVTWPNLLTTEAVRGAEQYKFDRRFPELAASHNTVLAFTRNVVGPMDYTPVTLSDAEFRRVTTAAHELALGVVFESGLQHLADTPARYGATGPTGLRLLRGLPVVWDEIELLAGRPGSHVVIARRHGDRWWIGGLNGTADTLALELDLGRLDGVGDLELAVDGEGRDDVELSVHTGDSLVVELAPSGGFVAWPSARVS